MQNQAISIQNLAQSQNINLNLEQVFEELLLKAKNMPPPEKYFIKYNSYPTILQS